MKVHHIGYLVKNIDKSINDFLLLGYKIEKKKIFDEKRLIYISFLVNGSYRIELVEPTNDCEFLKGLSKKLGGSGPYHICYYSENLDSDIAKLKNEGYLLIQDPLEAIAIDNKEVVFFYKKEVGLLELVKE